MSEHQREQLRISTHGKNKLHFNEMMMSALY